MAKFKYELLFKTIKVAYLVVFTLSAFSLSFSVLSRSSVKLMTFISMSFLSVFPLLIKPYSVRVCITFSRSFAEMMEWNYLLCILPGSLFYEPVREKTKTFGSDQV